MNRRPRAARTIGIPAGGHDLAAPPPRIEGIDALRGAAILAMIAYHFCFDLRYYGVLNADFEHSPFWLTARSLILSSFLLLAGISLVLAVRANPSPAKFWRRVGVIALCAIAVSAGSYALFPKTFIWFGVLHAIAVSLVLARPLVARPALALALGLAVLVAGVGFAHASFNQIHLAWIGFMTVKPATVDYVPLFPWTGVLLLGVALGHTLCRNNWSAAAGAQRWPGWVAFLGRHSLAVYMLHQPLLIGVLWLALKA